MTPVEMIKEGVRVKSWAMVKAALKEIEEKNIDLNTSDDSWSHEMIPQTELPIPDRPLPHSVLDKKPNKLKKPTPKLHKSTDSKNLFYDDGKTTKLGDVPIDGAQADLKIKYKEPPERTRGTYKQKYSQCSRCSKQYEISDLEYSYYKNPLNGADYICQNCLNITK